MNRILTAIFLWIPLACAPAAPDSENDIRFTPCDEVATCGEDTVCVYGLCQPLLLCDEDSDCARNLPNVCTDCSSVGNCLDVHGEARSCMAPRVCVALSEGSTTKICDQAGVGCEEEGNDYYCSRKEGRTCLRAQDAEAGSDPVFFCGPSD